MEFDRYRVKPVGHVLKAEYSQIGKSRSRYLPLLSKIDRGKRVCKSRRLAGLYLDETDRFGVQSNDVDLSGYAGADSVPADGRDEIRCHEDQSSASEIVGGNAFTFLPDCT